MLIVLNKEKNKCRSWFSANSGLFDKLPVSFKERKSKRFSFKKSIFIYNFPIKILKILYILFLLHLSSLRVLYKS